MIAIIVPLFITLAGLLLILRMGVDEMEFDDIRPTLRLIIAGLIIASWAGYAAITGMIQ